MRFLRRIAAAALLAAAPCIALSGERDAEPGAFDFYVLSLSWSPSYCMAEGAEANEQQCGGARPYAFVVHGLWPQYERGYPEFCRSRQADRVPDRLVQDYLDIAPSAGLIGHQWRKHGSCSGLGQSDYFALMREARQRIVVPSEFSQLTAPHMMAPDEVEKLFVSANPGLESEGIAVVCDRRYMREVRICLTRDLEFRTCQEVDRKACRLKKALMPPTRGG
ncbi:ribonuclease T2 family protein [Chelativorans salis]|uniref:Ribonuclease n=1 Tax=Chelativorans salis TaxID=2978478 RepID=A0ABT2LMW1_9HYPH|nr:ribonuclease [Chelativorans sp. EGI FJ00035]MCT7375911.1 ribonuclease [Chelativorans sp. EGI FJ00035]